MSNPEFFGNGMKGIKNTHPLRPRKKREPSKGEEAMAQHLNAYKIPFKREYMFHRHRKWRFDFAIQENGKKIAVEIEGGIWIKGAHTRGKHFTGDCEKYDEAALLGWSVYRFTPAQVKSGYAIGVVLKALGKGNP